MKKHAVLRNGLLAKNDGERIARIIKTKQKTKVLIEKELHE
jgi:hypothetical protein